MMAKVTRDLNVEFCKNFWSFAEHRLIAEGPNVILPSMAIAHMFELEPRPLRLPGVLDPNASGSESTGDISKTREAGSYLSCYCTLFLTTLIDSFILNKFHARPVFYSVSSRKSDKVRFLDKHCTIDTAQNSFPKFLIFCCDSTRSSTILRAPQCMVGMAYHHHYRMV